MSSPLTFTTEAERLNERDRYVRTCHAVDIANSMMRIGDDYYEHLFDTAFPPIAPPKMVPETRYCLVDANGQRCSSWSDEPWEPMPGGRPATCRVVEVDDE